MVGVQDQDTVHGAGEHGIDVVWLGGHRVHHVEKVFRVAEIVTRIHERLAERIFVGPGGDGWHFGDQAEGADFAVLRIIDVQAVVIEGRERADDAANDGHRMRVAAEAVVELAQLFMDHGVEHDAAVKIDGFLFGGQFTVQQQVGDFEEG